MADVQQNVDAAVIIQFILSWDFLLYQWQIFWNDGQSIQPKIKQIYCHYHGGDFVYWFYCRQIILRSARLESWSASIFRRCCSTEYVSSNFPASWPINWSAYSNPTLRPIPNVLQGNTRRQRERRQRRRDLMESYASSDRQSSQNAF